VAVVGRFRFLTLIQSSERVTVVENKRRRNMADGKDMESTVGVVVVVVVVGRWASWPLFSSRIWPLQVLEPPPRPDDAVVLAVVVSIHHFCSQNCPQIVLRCEDCYHWCGLLMMMLMLPV
jgi:hypothetical protein